VDINVICEGTYKSNANTTDLNS